MTICSREVLPSNPSELDATWFKGKAVHILLPPEPKTDALKAHAVLLWYHSSILFFKGPLNIRRAEHFPTDQMQARCRGWMHIHCPFHCWLVWWYDEGYSIKELSPIFPIAIYTQFWIKIESTPISEKKYFLIYCTHLYDPQCFCISCSLGPSL